MSRRKAMKRRNGQPMEVKLYKGRRGELHQSNWNIDVNAGKSWLGTSNKPALEMTLPQTVLSH